MNTKVYFSGIGSGLGAHDGVVSFPSLLSDSKSTNAEAIKSLEYRADSARSALGLGYDGRDALSLEITVDSIKAVANYLQKNLDYLDRAREKNQYEYYKFNRENAVYQISQLNKLAEDYIKLKVGQEAERKVSEEISGYLQNYDRILDNVNIENLYRAYNEKTGEFYNKKGTNEIDMLLVTINGVFAVEIKNTVNAYMNSNNINQLKYHVDAINYVLHHSKYTKDLEIVKKNEVNVSSDYVINNGTKNITDQETGNILYSPRGFVSRKVYADNVERQLTGKEMNLIEKALKESNEKSKGKKYVQILTDNIGDKIRDIDYLTRNYVSANDRYRPLAIKIERLNRAKKRYLKNTVKELYTFDDYVKQKKEGKLR